MKVIGFVGFKGAGKNTAAQPLEQNGFESLSFGAALKDVLSIMFGWPRHMLEGDTEESRIWREQIDHWWAARLGIPEFTPRLAMTSIGTEAIRNNFHQDFWVLNVEKKIQTAASMNRSSVVTDIRFKNEFDLIKNNGGKVYWVKKRPDPEWINIAINANNGDLRCDDLMRDHYKIHPTEYAWLGLPFDGIIYNDTTIEDLHEIVMKTV